MLWISRRVCYIHGIHRVKTRGIISPHGRFFIMCPRMQGRHALGVWSKWLSNVEDFSKRLTEKKVRFMSNIRGQLNRFKSAHLSGTQICKALVPRDQFEQGRGSHHRVATVYN